MIKAVDIETVVREYSQSRTRLILLDYDGTLVPFNPDYRLTVPAENVISLLHELAADTKNSVILISGRDRHYLEGYFKNAPFTLVAEHGGYYKNSKSAWNTMFAVSMNWIPQALAALQALVFQYEGSYVEQKTFSVAWHYRTIAERITESDRRQIIGALRAMPEYGQFVIYDGGFTVELRTPGIDKGSFVSRWVGGRYFDFIMSIGDGQTDEDVFRILRDDAYSIKVGRSDDTSANFYLESQQGVLPFLLNLLERKEIKSTFRTPNEWESVRKQTS